MATVTRSSFDLTVILRLSAFITFIAAEAVAQSWLNLGTWQEWVAAGLALWVLSDVL